jgi:hypothetical protein
MVFSFRAALSDLSTVYAMLVRLLEVLAIQHERKTLYSYQAAFLRAAPLPTIPLAP